jgi:hypothetical protein
MWIIESALGAQASSAQPQGTENPDDRTGTFRPVEGGGDERSGEVLLTVAYSVIWLMALLLILLSMRKQRQLDARITQLSQDLARARKAEPAGNPAKEKA